MLTPKQKEHTRRGATALNAAARLLMEAVDELVESPVISDSDLARLDREARRLCRKADAVSARAVRKQAFS